MELVENEGGRRDLNLSLNVFFFQNFRHFPLYPITSILEKKTKSIFIRTMTYKTFPPFTLSASAGKQLQNDHQFPKNRRCNPVCIQSWTSGYSLLIFCSVIISNWFDLHFIIIIHDGRTDGRTNKIIMQTIQFSFLFWGLYFPIFNYSQDVRSNTGYDCRNL